MLDHEAVAPCDFERPLVSVTVASTLLLAKILAFSASGGRCPTCDGWGVDARGRKYYCTKCNIQWNMDRGSTVREVLAYLG